MAENPLSSIRSEKPESALGQTTDAGRPAAIFFVIGGTEDLEGTGTGTIEQGSQDAVCLIVDPVVCDTYPQIIRAHEMRGAKIVILVDRADLSRMAEKDTAAAHALLADDIPAKALVRLLHRIRSGERVTSRYLISSAPARAAQPRSHPARREPELTVSEKGVLSGVVQGHSNNMIAWNLGITEPDVKIHLKSLMRKINVRNRTEATVWALSNRFVEDGPGPGFV